MPIREIVTVPQLVLRKKARKVTRFGKDLQSLIDDMIETMRTAPGVGLAAPQVDVSLRVIVVEFAEMVDEGEAPKPAKLYAVVNPEIVRQSDQLATGTEGCLSIPGLVGDVERPDAVIVRGLNRQGNAMRIKADGWLARIFQHEIDHLNGVLFTDLAQKVWMLEEEPHQVIAAD